MKRLNQPRKTKTPQPFQSDGPAYCGPHKSGQAYSTWPVGSPQSGEMKYHGKFGTVESHENFRRWKTELGVGIPIDVAPTLTIEEGVLFWCGYVEDNHLYEKEGRPTDTRTGYRTALKYVIDQYQNFLINDFGPFHLGVVIKTMIRKKLGRDTINSYLSRIKKVWRWFTKEGFCNRDSYVALTAVTALQHGEGGVEHSPVLSIDEAIVAETLKYVSPTIKAMIEVLCWSGARKSEVIRMRSCDLRDDHAAIPPELHGKCWVYLRARWKTEHHQGRRPLILLGPQAIAVLEKWIHPEKPEGFLFLPYESQAFCIRRRLSKGRAAPRKSMATLSKDRHYSITALNRAIRDACDKAGVPHWHPHQLRHLAATRLAEKHGLEITRILLGHRTIEMTLKYVDPGVVTPDDKLKYADAFAAIARDG